MFEHAHTDTQSSNTLRCIVLNYVLIHFTATLEMGKHHRSVAALIPLTLLLFHFTRKHTFSFLTLVRRHSCFNELKVHLN